MGLPTLPSLALVRRELVANLRRSRAIFWLVLLFVACTTVIAAGWPAGALLPRLAAERSGEMFRIMMFVLFGGCLLCVPAIGAGTIVSERQGDTLDMLRLTLLRPTSVILGKLANTVGFFLLLLIAMMPVIGILLSGVGLDWLQLALALLQILATAVTCALIGILCSAYFRKTIFAAAGSYAAVAALMGLPPLLIGIVALIAFWGPVPSGSFAQEVAVISSPATTLAAIVVGFSAVRLWHIAAHFGYLAIIGWFCLYYARKYLCRRGRHHVVETEKPIDDPALLSARRRKFPYYLLDPLKRKKPIEDRRNPMLVRELRWGLFSRSAVFVRLFYCVFPIFGFMTIWLLAFNVPDAEAIVGAAVLQMAVLVAVAPALLANTFTKEYELGNIDMLRMTLLSPRAVVHGKAWAGLMAQCPVFLAAAVCSLATFVFAPGFWLPLAAGLASLAACAIVSTSLGVFASLLTRRTTVSLILGYGLAFAAFVGLYGAAEGMNLYQASAADLSPPGIAAVQRATVAAGRLSPIVSYMIAFGGRSYESIQVRAWGLSVLVSVGLGFVILQVSSLVFARFRMQDP